MKKQLAILLFTLVSFSAIAQERLYRLPETTFAIRYDGTLACFDSIVSTYNFYPGDSYYGTPSNINGYEIFSGDLFSFDTIIGQVIIPKHIANTYQHKANVLYNHVYDKGQTDSIAALMLTQEEADLLYKGISYTPAWGDVTGKPTIKRQETYSGTTNGSGTYTVTFSTSYSVAPNIQANIINGTDNQIIRITDVSTTGFTVLVRNRTDVVGLLPSYSNVNGASVDVLITEK